MYNDAYRVGDEHRVHHAALRTIPTEQSPCTGLEEGDRAEPSALRDNHRRPFASLPPQGLATAGSSSTYLGRIGMEERPNGGDFGIPRKYGARLAHVTARVRVDRVRRPPQDDGDCPPTLLTLAVLLTIAESLRSRPL